MTSELPVTGVGKKVLPLIPLLFPPLPPDATAPLPPRMGKRRCAGMNKLSFCYTSSGDSQRKETILNFLPNALFTALSSVSSREPLFILTCLAGVSGLLTGST